MINFEDITPEIIKIFWSKVKLGKNGECNEWIGSKDRDNYGLFSFRINKKQILIKSHRFAWMIYHKQNITKGLVIMHICDNPSCVSKNCLILGTHLANMHDKIKKGRAYKIIFSEEVRKKISEKNKGHKRNLGRKHTQEARKNMGSFKIGNKFNLGKNRPPEVKEKISIANTGKKRSLAIKQKLSTSAKNRWVNIDPEEKQKLLKNLELGRGNHTPETIQKIVKANTGRKFSEETKIKMSISTKAYHARKKLEKLIPS
jgi:hypothetical protein